MPAASSFKATALHRIDTQLGQMTGSECSAVARFLELEQINRSSHRLPSITNPLVRRKVCP